MAGQEDLRPSFEADETFLNTVLLSVPEESFIFATDTPSGLGAACLLGAKRSIPAEVVDTRLDFARIVEDL